jgi:hypothetical protein
MPSRKQHRHWVSAIQTKSSNEPVGDDPYGGVRLFVCHSKAESESDLLEWIVDELEEEFDNVDAAVKAYKEKTGLRVVREEQYG